MTVSASDLTLHTGVLLAGRAGRGEEQTLVGRLWLMFSFCMRAMVPACFLKKGAGGVLNEYYELS